MNLTTQTFEVTDRDIFKQKMLNWASRFSIFCFLDNNSYHYEKPAFECILAAGALRTIELIPGTSFEALQKFYDLKPGWLFGHLGYELRNEVESLVSHHTNVSGFGDGYFFEPQFTVRLSGTQVSIEAQGADASVIYKQIIDQPSTVAPKSTSNINLRRDLDRDAYIKIIRDLKEHIHRGDCYEINFCQRFSAGDAVIDPLNTYLQLITASPMPFAALYKKNEHYCLCASPERYLKKTGTKLISQPMKGTSRRNVADALADEQNKDYLKTSAKEKSENVMVVDLVRNDLSKICKEGTVTVDELFGVYSFPQVHQMSSTVSGQVSADLDWTDIIKATFPMGSMTGAPKKRVMELIDQYETSNRGLFSGSIGYIDPAGDFDFNVVIRSIFYNEASRELSFFAGSGITFFSDPEAEYEECELKIAAILQVLTG